ncbi:helix-turn-helix transcriptional regulator [Leptolyngbya sp. KIOST-1]|uniref:helix-turn-helix transcriptional regulator n=1 Tax=Leptolyngbya sp. KIOST-1 TaxID=1229172 RepID=UPI0018CD3728|nr:LuxR family transcriptional regulator [Leptolyngbya sp. KIOST-1]
MSSSTIASTVDFSVPHNAHETPNQPLLSAVLEGFVDGILVLAEDGRCVHSNQKGKTLCRDLSDPKRPGDLPTCLKTMSKHLLESRELYPETLLVLTQEFTSRSGHQIRARVQWLDCPATPGSYLLVSLENKTRLAQSSALLEAVQYNLTPREQAVWVLRRANRSYEEIAKELYITINTVKRHLKSIYAKRKDVTEALAN